MNNEISLGTWLSLYSEAIAEVLVNAGYEWVTVDLEHSAITIDQAEKLIRVIDLAGAKPYVRVSSNDAVQIKRVLDAGAQGIIVPMVNTKDDVLAAISAMNYPPLGSRGMGLARAQGYGEANLKSKYIEKSSKELELYIQIESKDALDNLDDIFSQNIDGYMIGPYDLSSSMGIPGDFKNQDFLEIEASILNTAKKYDIKRGYHIVEPDTEQLNARIDQGYNFIAFSVDFRMLDVMARKPFNND
ncbi:aldolase/citrate lyase family protein [Gammaproteobacteria bacterium]|nr:aldolase/citrate lyase family protein [Gammaproteobacteria bacterium]|tara:strand:- start:1164 stop:1895 length:732 start_codon:yes stop_codon:yes gene_type:complete